MAMWLLLVAGAAFGLVVPPLTLEEARRCHRPSNRRSARDCLAYVKESPRDELARSYPNIDAACFNVTWQSSVAASGNATVLGTSGKWGSCVATSTDGEYRYFVSNSVPNHYFGPYCPLGLGLGYCVGEEACVFEGLACGGDSVSSSRGYTPLGDVWVPSLAYAKMPVAGDPTRADRPGSMYATVEDGAKNVGAATAMTIEDGITIQGPNDAGDYDIDEAGFVLPCGGHVTPPQDFSPGGLAPYFHYHKAPTCKTAFVDADRPAAHGGDAATAHGTLFAYALDGFGIYTFSDIGGAAPVLDECGGHFGPTDDDDDDSVVYHYHSTPYTPYHLACQGPALSNCDATQTGTSFCGSGCGADLCIQPGTSGPSLRVYAASFGNTSWFDAYTNNIDAARVPLAPNKNKRPLSE